MTHWAVDTNVPRVSNYPHDPTDASPECVLECVRWVREITTRGGLLLDDGWRIIREYQNHLRSAGQPGVGDAFLRTVLVVNAVDSDWWEYREALERNGVRVECLCPGEIAG
jgi:hypothetical protein